MNRLILSKPCDAEKNSLKRLSLLRGQKTVLTLLGVVEGCLKKFPKLARNAHFPMKLYSSPLRP